MVAHHAIKIFSGAGNKFVVLDGRAGLQPDIPEIIRLCREYRTDGLMILSLPAGASLRDEAPDFVMEFYNPDGSGGMMCGNGGRCIAAFANMLGIGPSEAGAYNFLAPDGMHRAKILSRVGERWMVELGMRDVESILPVLGGYFLNTGTRHFVKFVEDVEVVDIDKEGPAIRHDKAFAPEGTNVNFVQPLPDGSLKVRTFEKGVEGETLACGTGITASALAWAHVNGLKRGPIEVSARIDRLAVDFEMSCGDSAADGAVDPATASYKNITLTGPAEML